MNRLVIVLFTAISILSVVSGFLFYQLTVVQSVNSELRSQNAEIQNQLDEVQTQNEELENQIANLTSANLVTALGIAEVPYDSIANPAQFHKLFIEGSVTNKGQGTAYNAGLHVVAYDAEGNLRINMIVPLKNIASFGTDSATIDYALAHAGGTDSLQLGKLLTTQTAAISIQIFHQGNVTDWTLTPVWTNSP
jgi:type II secretory pathway pseudopilin PulG